MKRILSLLLALALILSLAGWYTENPQPSQTQQTLQTQQTQQTEALLDEDGSYDSKEDVALYLHQYGHLPGNYMTKAQARKQGWKSGALSSVLPGKCIGGDVFHNREGLLPNKAGRTYYECDIGTLNSGSRGAKRIVFSDDGLVYYTHDHYGSFQLLYGEP